MANTNKSAKSPVKQRSTAQREFDFAGAGLQATMMAGADDGGMAVMERAPQTGRQVRRQRPQMWKIIALNDNTTPFDFAWYILKKHFQISMEKAIQIADTIHNQGSCVIAVYEENLAKAKTEKVNNECKNTPHPTPGKPTSSGMICPQMIEFRMRCEPE